MVSFFHRDKTVQQIRQERREGLRVSGLSKNFMDETEMDLVGWRRACTMCVCDRDSR